MKDNEINEVKESTIFVFFTFAFLIVLLSSCFVQLIYKKEGAILATLITFGSLYLGLIISYLVRNRLSLVKVIAFSMGICVLGLSIIFMGYLDVIKLIAFYISGFWGGKRILKLGLNNEYLNMFK